jgi:hypothetical protein
MLFKKVAKTVFHSAFTAEQLIEHHKGLLKNINLPSEFATALDEMKALTGGDLREVVRGYHIQQLKDIGALRPWAIQRRKAIELCLVENTWRATYLAARDFRREAWAHAVKGVEMFERRPKEHWQYLLHQRYLLALMSGSYVETLGRAFFDFTEAKTLEIDAHKSYLQEIRKLDFGMVEQMHIAIDEGRDDDAQWLANVIDDVVQPIIVKQNGLLERMRSEILDSNLDVDETQREVQRLEEVKEHVGRALKAGRPSA